MSKKNYKTLLNDITTFIFDVDGVLTNGKVMVTSEGEMYREMDTKDGFALKYALQKGFKMKINEAMCPCFQCYTLSIL